MTEIQIQFKYNETIRCTIIEEPRTYEELEHEIKSEVPKMQDVEFGLMYENHDGDCCFKRNPRCLRLAITSSSVVPGTQLKRLKLLIFVGHSPSQQKEKDLDSPTHSPFKKRVCAEPQTAIVNENSQIESNNQDRRSRQQPAFTKNRGLEYSDNETKSHISIHLSKDMRVNWRRKYV